MPVKLLLDSNKIYHKEFEGSKPGYDALQVDSFLDLVMKDYDSFNSYVSSLEEKVNALETKNHLLSEQLTKCEAEKASYEAKIGDIKDNKNASLDNLEYIKRISALEKALSKAGINPNTIK